MLGLPGNLVEAKRVNLAASLLPHFPEWVIPRRVNSTFSCTSLQRGILGKATTHKSSWTVSTWGA